MDMEVCMGNKQMRVQDAVHEEISRLSKAFGVDKQTILNTSIAIMKQILETGTETVEVMDHGTKKVIPVLLLSKKKAGVSDVK